MRVGPIEVLVKIAAEPLSQVWESARTAEHKDHKTVLRGGA
jgi:hypothetical protein